MEEETAIESEEEEAESLEDENVEGDEEVSEELEAPKKGLLSFSKKLPHLQAYRDGKLRKRLLLIVACFLLPLIAAVYYISPLSNLSEVNVKVAKKVKKEAILQSADFMPGERLWPQYFERKTAIHTIKEDNPRIKTATISLAKWNQLLIQVTEYQEVAFLVKGNAYLPILENGRIIQEPIKKINGKSVILENFSKEKMILAVLKEYEQLPVEIQESISQVKLTPSQKKEELLTLFMNDGNQVLVNISDLSQQMKYYLQVAKEMKTKGVVDMEVGIYTYPYAEKESEETENTHIEESF